MSDQSRKKPRTRVNARRAGYERPVEQIANAALFTDDPAGQDPAEFLRELRRYPFVTKLITDYETARRQLDGRPRHEGDRGCCSTSRS